MAGIPITTNPALPPNCQDIIPADADFNLPDPILLDYSDEPIARPAYTNPPGSGHPGPRHVCTNTPADAGPIQPCVVQVGGPGGGPCGVLVCATCNTRNQDNWERVLEACRLGCCETCIKRERNRAGVRPCVCPVTPARVCEMCVNRLATRLQNDGAAEYDRREHADFRPRR